jgi:predicted dienelactone hydrolase
VSADGYDPFRPGPYAVAVRTVRLADPARGRELPCDVWYPRADADAAVPLAGRLPLVVFSHLSGGHRRSSAFLCTHLASHGYAVAAPDHSEVVVPELVGFDAETSDARAARVAAVVASRVPDVRLVLDQLADEFDGTRVAIVGHSFGGWTALATPDDEPRVSSVVALAPGGSARPRPGILPVGLPFQWPRDLPTLVLTGDQDVMTPLDGVVELFERIPATTKRMVVLRGADHLHFTDDVAEAHESLRRSTLPGEAGWIPAAMRPITELCPPASAHAFTRGLVLAHLDASIRDESAARASFDASITAAMRRHGIDAYEWNGETAAESP